MLKDREINNQKFWVFGPLIEENSFVLFFFFKLVYFFISLIPGRNCPFDCDFPWAFLTLGGKDHKMDEEHPQNEKLCVNSLFLSTCLVWSMRRGQMEQHGCCYLLCWWVALAAKTMSRSLSYVCREMYANFSESICKSSNRCPCSESSVDPLVWPSWPWEPGGSGEVTDTKL